MNNRNLIIATVSSACLAALFCYLWVNNSFFQESKLIGEWHYSFRDDYYPKYTTTLTFKADGTFAKTEEYTGSRESPTVATAFSGVYSTGPNIPVGSVFIAVNNGAAKLEGKVVMESPQGGYGSAFEFAFDQSGKLLITNNVDTLSGHSKNPTLLKRFALLPSWGAFSKAN